MAEAINTTSADISTKTRALTISDLNTKVNDEPRIADVRLAETLGFERPRKIKDLIERHRASLERFGPVCSTAGQTSPKGGRPGKTYWLNKRQALYICTKSEAPLATEATIQMVEVFDAWLKGRFTENQPPQLEPGLMYFRLAGRDILIDSRDYRIGPGDQALVCGYDGKMTVLRGPLETERGGARTAGHWRKATPQDHFGATAVRDYFTVIGRLIQAGEKRRRISAYPALLAQ